MSVKKTAKKATQKAGASAPAIPVQGKTFTMEDIERTEKAVNLLFTEWRPPKRMSEDNSLMLAGQEAFAQLQWVVNMMYDHRLDDISMGKLGAPEQ